MLRPIHGMETFVPSPRSAAGAPAPESKDTVTLSSRRSVVEGQETALPYELQHPEGSNDLWLGNKAGLHHAEQGYLELHMRVTEEYLKRFSTALDGTPYALTQPEKTALKDAGEVYDLGKIVVDDKILGKKGPLTDEEAREVARHVMVRTNRFPEGGDQQVEKRFSAHSDARRDGVREIIRHHHERWDGGGYPDGLKGHDIPLGAQVLGLSDAWDSLTCRRPWRTGLGYAEARQAIEELTAQGQFNPELVALFFERAVPDEKSFQEVNGQRLQLAEGLHQSYEWNELRAAQDTEILLGQGYIAWDSLQESLKPRADSALLFERSVVEMTRQVETLASPRQGYPTVQEAKSFVQLGGIRLKRRS